MLNEILHYEIQDDGKKFLILGYNMKRDVSVAGRGNKARCHNDSLRL